MGEPYFGNSVIKSAWLEADNGRTLEKNTANHGLKYVQIKMQAAPRVLPEECSRRCGRGMLRMCC